MKVTTAGVALSHWLLPAGAALLMGGASGPLQAQLPPAADPALPDFSAGHTRLVFTGRVTQARPMSGNAGEGRSRATGLADSPLQRYESVTSRRLPRGAYVSYVITSGAQQVVASWPDDYAPGTCVQVFVARAQKPAAFYAYGEASVLPASACP